MAKKTASKPSARSPKNATRTAKTKTAKKKAPAKKKARAASTAKSTKKKAAPKAKKSGDEEVLIDRRRTDRRSEAETAQAEPTAKKPVLERRQKVNRRRQIDPTTCERDYSDAEVEFMNALDDYKRKSGRMFPTCSEVLEVVRDLGYVQLTAAEKAAREAAVGDSLERDAEQQAEEALAESEALHEEELAAV